MILRDGVQIIITEKCYSWRKTFVIGPVTTITGKKVCFKRLYKRKIFVRYGGGFYEKYLIQYATLFEILNSDN